MATDVAKSALYVPAMLTQWLKDALAHSKLTQAELARRLAARLGPSYERSKVNKMALGKRDIDGVELLAISEITGFPVPTPLIRSEDIESTHEPSVAVMIKGFVQAGNWVENPEWPADEWCEIHITPVREYPGKALHACRVRGPSMNKLYPDGTILVWVSIVDVQEPPISGKRYIVRRTRDAGSLYEMTVKTYLESETGKWLISESDDPRYQGAIRLTENEDDQVEIVGRVVRSIREE
jgi:SOS-response transcriptional repressor LexA